MERATLDPVALSWRIKERPGHTLVEFFGEIDENADFAELRRRLTGTGGTLVFQLGDVRRINSCGVREWVNFVRELGTPAAGELVFTHCSPAIVTQLNMIYNFRGQAMVRSFMAPYVCPRCDHEEEKLLDVSVHFASGSRKTRVAPEFTCPKCSSKMDFDDLPERYLSFLHDS
jgi:hypothetical protein